MAYETKGTRKYVESSLVWDGNLYYNPKKPGRRMKKFNKSHRRWCEFHREVSYLSRELRFYVERPNDTQRIGKVIDTIPLRGDVIKVMFGMDYFFKIVTGKKTYVFGTDTLEEAKIWSDCIWKELYGPVKAGVVYNFNVQVERNRTTQKYNVVGSYLLKIFDDKLKLFTPNGLQTQVEVWIKDIVKASSPPVYCLSLAVLNISTRDVGGDVMLFNADCAHDIVRIINHRRQLLFGSHLSTESSRPVSVPNNVPINVLHCSETHPYPITSSAGIRDHRSRSHPVKPISYAPHCYELGREHADVRKQKMPLIQPYLDIGKFSGARILSAPDITFVNNKVDEDVRVNSRRSVSSDQISGEGPALLLRSPASLVSQESISLRSSISSISSLDNGYVVPSITATYLKLYWKDANPYEEIKYSDSELLLSKQQKSETSAPDSDIIIPKKVPLPLSSSLISEKPPQRSAPDAVHQYDFIDYYSKAPHYISDSDVNAATCSTVTEPVCKGGSVGDLTNKHAFKLSDNEYNLSDGELCLSAGQKRMSKKSKKMSKKGPKDIPKASKTTINSAVTESSMRTERVSKVDVLDYLNSSPSLHVYSKVTKNRPLPSPPVKTGYHHDLKTSSIFDDSYSPDHTYSCPFWYDWMNGDVEHDFVSDSEVCFGKVTKSTSMRCKRYSRIKRDSDVWSGLHEMNLCKANKLPAGDGEKYTSKRNPRNSGSGYIIDSHDHTVNEIETICTDMQEPDPTYAEVTFDELQFVCTD